MEYNKEGLKEIKENFDIIREEVQDEKNIKREINPYFTEYILKKLEDIEELSLEDILNKLDFLCLQIKDEYEKDIKVDFGDYLIKILDKIKSIIDTINKENSSKQSSFVQQIKVKANESKAIDAETHGNEGEQDGRSEDR